MQNVVKFIYPKIWRIPEDYSSKCILRGELYENKDCKIHVLNVVCGSHLQHFSPYDSALILDLLTNKFIRGGKKESSKILQDYKYKSHPLYRPALNRLVDSVINYRTELFPYFYRKFSELHEVSALKSILKVILDTGSLSNYNLNCLVDLSYLTSYHIPSTITKDTKFDSLNKDYIFYNRFYAELIENLEKLLNPKNLNKVLVYKLLYSLSKIPFEFDYKKIYRPISEKVEEILKNNSWESQYLIRVYTSLHKLDLLNPSLITLIYRCMEKIIHELETKDLRLLLLTSTKLNDSLSNKFTSIIKDQLKLYKKLQNS